MRYILLGLLLFVTSDALGGFLHVTVRGRGEVRYEDKVCSSGQSCEPFPAAPGTTVTLVGVPTGTAKDDAACPDFKKTWEGWFSVNATQSKTTAPPALSFIHNKITLTVLPTVGAVPQSVQGQESIRLRACTQNQTLNQAPWYPHGQATAQVPSIKEYESQALFALRTMNNRILSRHAATVEEITFPFQDNFGWRGGPTLIAKDSTAYAIGFNDAGIPQYSVKSSLALPWSTPIALGSANNAPSFRTLDTIAGTAYQNKMYLFARSTTGELWYNVQEPSNVWSSWTKIPGPILVAAPTVAAADRLHIFVRRSDQFIHEASWNTGNNAPGAWAPIVGSNRTTGNITAVHTGNQLLIGGRTTGNQILLNTRGTFPAETTPPEEPFVPVPGMGFTPEDQAAIDAAIEAERQRAIEQARLELELANRTQEALAEIDRQLREATAEQRLALEIQRAAYLREQERLEQERLEFEALEAALDAEVAAVVREQAENVQSALTEAMKAEQAREAAEQAAREVEAALAATEAALAQKAQNLAEAQSQIAALTNALQLAQSERAALENTIASLDSQIAALQTVITGTNQELQATKAQRDALEQERNNLLANLGAARDREAHLASQLATEQQRVITLSAENQTLQAQTEALEEQNALQQAAAAAEIAARDAEITRNRNLLAEALNNLQAAQTALAVTGSELTSTQQALLQTGNALIASQNALAVSEGKVASANQTIAALQSQLAAANTNNAGLTQQVNTLNATILALEQQIAVLGDTTEITALYAERDALQAQLTASRNQVISLTNQLIQSAAEIASLENTVSQRNTQVSQLQSQLNTANSTISSLQAQLASVGGSSSELQAELTAAIARANSLESQLIAANANISGLQSALATANLATQYQIDLLVQREQIFAEELAAAEATISSGQVALEQAAQRESDYQATIQGLGVSLAQVQNELATATGRISTLTGENTSLRSQLSVTRNQLAITQGNLSATQADLAAAQTALSQTQDALGTANITISNLQSANASLHQQVAFVTSQAEQAAAAAEDLRQQHLQQISDLQTALQQSLAREAALRANLSTSAQEKESLQATINGLQDTIAEKNVQIGNLNQEIAGWRTAYQVLNNIVFARDFTIQNQQDYIAFLEFELLKARCALGWVTQNCP